jgi:hypothetical protein
MGWEIASHREGSQSNQRMKFNLVASAGWRMYIRITSRADQLRSWWVPGAMTWFHMLQSDARLVDGTLAGTS